MFWVQDYQCLKQVIKQSFLRIPEKIRDSMKNQGFLEKIRDSLKNQGFREKIRDFWATSRHSVEISRFWPRPKRLIKHKGNEGKSKDSKRNQQRTMKAHSQPMRNRPRTFKIHPRSLDSLRKRENPSPKRVFRSPGLGKPQKSLRGPAQNPL